MWYIVLTFENKQWFSVECLRSSHLLFFCFTSPCDWFSKLAPLSRPMRKLNLNPVLHARTQFSALALVVRMLVSFTFPWPVRCRSTATISFPLLPLWVLYCEEFSRHLRTWLIIRFVFVHLIFVHSLKQFLNPWRTCCWLCLQPGYLTRKNVH